MQPDFVQHPAKIDKPAHLRAGTAKIWNIHRSPQITQISANYEKAFHHEEHREHEERNKFFFSPFVLCGESYAIFDLKRTAHSKKNPTAIPLKIASDGQYSEKLAPRSTIERIKSMAYVAGSIVLIA